MRNTLYAKLAAVLLALFGVVGAVYVSVTLFATRMYLDEVNQKLNRNRRLVYHRSGPVRRCNRDYEHHFR